MKRFIFILICVCSVNLYLNAQHQVNNFFDEMGIAQIKTETYNPQLDTILVTDHRAEDVIWSRVVYRVIDMRYKQNFQLYFPTRCDDPDYRSLFNIIIDAIVENDLTVYRKRPSLKQIQPDYDSPIDKPSMPSLFIKEDSLSVANEDEYTVVKYDSTEQVLSFECFRFPAFAQNQLKYVIQEVIFFDRHYSRLYSKIMAIAPLQSDRITTKSEDPKDLTKQLMESLLFWIPFDSLRPYLQRQFVIPFQNDTKRVTYDEFFQKKLYTSYILGDGNIYNRIITDYAHTPEEVKKEQDRIAEELLNFEQDLWEY